MTTILVRSEVCVDGDPTQPKISVTPVDTITGAPTAPAVVLNPDGTEYLGGGSLERCCCPTVTSLWLFPSVFESVVGAPTLSTIGSNLPAWLFDAAADEEVSTGFRVPTGWNTFDVDFVVVNATADAGTVRFFCEYTEYANGGNVTGAASVANYDWVAEAQNLHTTLVGVRSGLLCQPGSTQLLRVGRQGTAGPDTKTGDAAIVAVRARQAS